MAAIVKFVPGLRMEINVMPEGAAARDVRLRDLIRFADEALPLDLKKMLAEIHFTYRGPSLTLVLMVPEGIDLLAVQRLQARIRDGIDRRAAEFLAEEKG